MNSDRQLARYQRSVSRRLYTGWAIALLSVVAIIGWSLDLATGISPFPAIKWVLIFGAGCLVAALGFRTRNSIIDRDAMRPGVRGELAKIHCLKAEQDVRLLSDLRKSLECEEESSRDNSKVEPRLDE